MAHDHGDVDDCTTKDDDGAVTLPTLVLDSATAADLPRSLLLGLSRRTAAHVLVALGTFMAVYVPRDRCVGMFECALTHARGARLYTVIVVADVCMKHSTPVAQALAPVVVERLLQRPRLYAAPSICAVITAWGTLGLVPVGACAAAVSWPWSACSRSCLPVACRECGASFPDRARCLGHEQHHARARSECLVDPTTVSAQVWAFDGSCRRERRPSQIVGILERRASRVSRVRVCMSPLRCRAPPEGTVATCATCGDRLPVTFDSVLGAWVFRDVVTPAMGRQGTDGAVAHLECGL